MKGIAEIPIVLAVLAVIAVPPAIAIDPDYSYKPRMLFMNEVPPDSYFATNTAGDSVWYFYFPKKGDASSVPFAVPPAELEKWIGSKNYNDMLHQLSEPVPQAGRPEPQAERPTPRQKRSKKQKFQDFCRRAANSLTVPAGNTATFSGFIHPDGLLPADGSLRPQPQFMQGTINY